MPNQFHASGEKILNSYLQDSVLNSHTNPVTQIASIPTYTTLVISKTFCLQLLQLVKY